MHAISNIEVCQDTAVFLKLYEEGAEVLIVFLGGMAEDKDVVYTCEAEF